MGNREKKVLRIPEEENTLRNKVKDITNIC